MDCGTDEVWIVDVLESLVDKSLLSTQQLADLDEIRLCLLDSIRDYAAEKLDDLGLRPQSEARFSTRVLSHLKGSWGRRNSARIRAHLDDLANIHRRAQAKLDHEQVVASVLAG
ncbi:MAG: hypothetical protein HN348_19185, partial [Proteobacteria bacterium]|nr:hypothetical protein [Pseudomonadota bacterium]